MCKKPEPKKAAEIESKTHCMFVVMLPASLLSLFPYTRLRNLFNSESPVAQW